MSELENDTIRNPYLDEYNHNIKEESKFQKLRAKKFIPTQYDLLIKAGFKPTNAGDRLKMDLSEIWCERTIRDYLPIEARHLEKIRVQTSDPSITFPYEGEFTSANLEDETEKQIQESNKKVIDSSEMEMLRICPSCQTIIKVSKDYKLSSR